MQEEAWTCTVCTYVHSSEKEKSFLSCAMCATPFATPTSRTDAKSCDTAEVCRKRPLQQNPDAWSDVTQQVVKRPCVKEQSDQEKLVKPSIAFGSTLGTRPCVDGPTLPANQKPSGNAFASMMGNKTGRQINEPLKQLKKASDTEASTTKKFRPPPHELENCDPWDTEKVTIPDRTNPHSDPSSESDLDRNPSRDPNSDPNCNSKCKLVSGPTDQPYLPLTGGSTTPRERWRGSLQRSG